MTTAKDWPRLAVIGAGAVGGYFGGMLARAGAPVTMIGRPQFVAAVMSNGLLVETSTGDARIGIEASTEMTDAATADVILLCVKTSDTAAAVQELARVMKTTARVVSLQNGVDNVERIREASGIEAWASAVYVAASVVRPGHIRHLARGDLVVGPEAAEVAQLLTRAGIPCVISKNLPVELWTKLATNCALNALSALSHSPYGRIIAHQDGRSLIDRIVDEVFAVAQASGVGAPEFSKQSLRKAALDLAQQMPTTISSTAQDLARGKKTEIDSLNGYISRRGDELGVATPVNAILRSLIRLAEQTQQPLPAR